MVVTDGHLTKEPTEPVYSGVVSLRKIRLAMFFSELNNLQLWGANIGNGYLQALTKEHCTLYLAQKFEEFQEHFFSMYKAPYGTTSGGPCWHDKSLDHLQQMNFLQPPLFWKGGTGELTAKQRRVTEFPLKISYPYSYLIRIPSIMKRVVFLPLRVVSPPLSAAL